MEKKPTTAVTAGLILSLVLILLSLIAYFTGMYMESWYQYVGFGVIVAGIIWSIYRYAKETGYSQTFGNLFAYGFRITAVITCMIILYTMLSGLLFPDIKQKIIEVARAQALKNPGANEDAIDQSMTMFSKNYTLIVVMLLLFWYLVIGVISSLIGAAITRKDPKNNFDQI